MRKVIAAINMTIDGFCDHTAMIADERIHEHFTTLLRNSGTILYGRITYQLMESYWPSIVQNPTGVKTSDEFALAIQDIPKIVFSNTLKTVGWKNALKADRNPEEVVQELKQQPGKDILVGSPGLIVALTKPGLIDEYQLMVHPVILGEGLPLFKSITDRIVLTLEKSEIVSASGAMNLCYIPKNS